MLKKGSRLGRVEDVRFEVEGWDPVFERPKDFYVYEVKIPVHGFDRLQVLVHRQNRKPAGWIAVSGNKTAGLSVLGVGSSRPRGTHSAAGFVPSRSVVIAAAVRIDADFPFGVRLMRQIAGSNPEEFAMAKKKRGKKKRGNYFSYPIHTVFCIIRKRMIFCQSFSIQSLSAGIALKIVAYATVSH